MVSTGQIRNAHKTVFGKPGGRKKPPARPVCRWEDNIKVILKK
jgi:hypothetical protein